MLTLVVCPADGKSDGVQKVTALIGAASDALRSRLARPEITQRPETGASPTEVDWAPKVGEANNDAAALEQREQIAQQIGHAQLLWDTRLYGRCLGKASKILQVAAYSRRYHHRMGMAH